MRLKILKICCHRPYIVRLPTNCMDLTEKTIESIRMKPNHRKHSNKKVRHHHSAGNEPKHRIAKIKYIGVEFDPVKIGACEKEVNAALSQGYEPIRDVDTARGIVLVMGLWEKVK